MPAALQLVVFLCYLILLHEPPLLALQIGPEKNFGRAVGRAVAIAWTLNKTYISLLLHRGSGRAMLMCDVMVERLHWMLLFCCKCTCIAPKWHAVSTTRA
jgi:hypothetical protein